MARKTDKTRWTEAGFVIRLVSKGKPYQVDEGTRDGKRRRVRFEHLKQAQQHCQRLRTDLLNKGTAGQNLSDRDRVEAAEARAALGAVPIMDAVRFYLRHHATGAAGMTVADLIAEYLKAPGRRGGKLIERRPVTVEAARKRLAPFGDTFGKRAVSDITRPDVEGWLDAGGWSGLNRRHYLANARALYGYAVRKAYVALNPAEGVELPEDPEAVPPAILTPKQVAAVLKAATAEAPDLVPRLAVSFFAGLRPTELTRLDWSAVNLAGGFITVNPETAKMRRQRHVEIPANLSAWLTPHRKASGALWPKGSTTYWHKLGDVLERVNLKALPYNAGRHAFASYHLAMHEDPGKTSLQLGHTKPDLLFNVYRGIHQTDGAPVTKEAATAYFGIRPEGKADIIQLPLAAAG